MTKARPERARPKNKTPDPSKKCEKSESKPDLVLTTREQTGVLFAVQKIKLRKPEQSEQTGVLFAVQKIKLR